MGTTVEIRSEQSPTLTANSDRNQGASGSRYRVSPKWPFRSAIFLSAYLLFQVQLLLGKQILPQFGGAPAVWTTCLLVFQLLLLAGYAYSHGVGLRMSLRAQIATQLCLLALSMAIFAARLGSWSTPITPGARWRPEAVADPTWSILWFVLLAIGLPFFLLSTTSPLLQHWFAKISPAESPYRLYALSNAGSLLGLLSYPFVLEPNLRLRTQAWLWLAGYALYVAAYSVCALLVRRLRHEPIPAGVQGAETTSRGMTIPVLQTALAACASAMLLASSNLICQEVAVIPFLWVLPLSLYLLSFILCFESDRWYRRTIFHPFFAAAAGLAILVSMPDANYSVLTQVAAYCALLFTICMVCHGEAARSRPDASGLTGFYLRIAVGGALGGIFVSLVAPRIFPNYWEYPLGVLVCAALLLVFAGRDPASWWHTSGVPAALLLFAGITLLAPSVLAPVWKEAGLLSGWASKAIAGSLAVAAAIHYLLARRAGTLRPSPFAVRLAVRVALALLTAGLVIPQKSEFYHVVARSRSFYGVLSVVAEEADHYLVLRHGKTLHGLQYQDPQRSQEATAYYGQHSGANIAIRSRLQHPMRVGLIGMGAGTLATLAHPGDTFRFYELNPDVYKWSTGEHPYFTFLRGSAGHIEVVLGDGRVSLEQEASRGEFQKFDVLVLDAFSSDAIPMHLLTQEAFGVYAKHLRGRDSIIAVHISNHTLDLRPVLAGICRRLGYHALRDYQTGLTGPYSQSDWILLSQDSTALAGDELQAVSEPFPAKTRAVFWTDDYCGLMHLLRPRDH